MSQQDPHEPQEHDELHNELTEETDAPAEAEPVEEPDVADDPLKTLQAERDELHDRLLRVSAEYQNYAKRTAVNLENAQRQKVVDIARGLVSALDHFDRALQVDPDTTSTPDLLKGVTGIRDELLKALQSFGIERVDVAAGEEFDPNVHEALMRQPSEDVDSNHVVMQLQPGYVVGDRVVRPAQVAVAE